MLEQGRQKKAKVWVAVVVAWASSTSASFAQAGPEGLRLGEPRYGGSGCPQGSLSAALSPDALSLSLIFDRFTVEAGGARGPNVAEKSCRVGIPIQIPEGYQVALVRTDFRGFASIPLRGRGYLTVSGSYPGAPGQRYQQVFSGGFEDEFTLSTPAQAVPSYSACGGEVLFDAQIALSLQSDLARSEAQLSLDSADLDAGAVFELRWRACSRGYVPAPSAGGDGRATGRPSPSQGRCRMVAARAGNGNTIYRVLDAQTRVLATASSQAEALRYMTRDSRCN